MPGKDNNFGGSLVLDFRKWWRHVQPKNRHGTQQWKPNFLLHCKIFTELRNSPLRNIHFFQNADSWFLMNTVICSILTLFVQVANIGINIRHHSNFRIANFLNFLKAYVTSRCCAPETWSQELHMISCITNH